MRNPRSFTTADEELLNDLRQPEKTYDGLERHFESSEFEVTYV